VSLSAFANPSGDSIVVFVDEQQEYLANPGLLAVFDVDRFWLIAQDWSAGRSARSLIYPTRPPATY
jgi:hypothetical protein